MAMFNIHDPHSLEGAQVAMRIRSCSGGAASAYLEVLPLTHKLRLANSHLTWELRFRNSIQVLPTDNPGKCCPCGDMLRGMRNTDLDHALSCPKHSGLRTLRLEYLNKVWCDASHCAGVAPEVEPKLRELQMQPGVRRHENAREDARRIAGHAGKYAGDRCERARAGGIVLAGYGGRRQVSRSGRRSRSDGRTKRTSTAVTLMAALTNGSR